MRVATGRSRAAARREAMSKEEKECVVDKLRRGVRQAFVNLTKVGVNQAVR
jgi:hypothetical protein